jgi:hypothetical protein
MRLLHTFRDCETQHSQIFSMLWENSKYRKPLYGYQTACTNAVSMSRQHYLHGGALQHALYRHPFLPPQAMITLRGNKRLKTDRPSSEAFNVKLYVKAII